MGFSDKLSNTFPNLKITKLTTPTYVKFHTGIDGDIVLVSSKNKNTTASTTNKSSRYENISELELTGSPLKLDLSLKNILDDTILMDETQHWTREESEHLPLKLVDAINVANVCNDLQSEMCKEESIPVWIICNGKDEKNTLVLGCLSDEGFFNRGIIYDSGDIEFEKIKFDDIRKWHKDNLHTPMNQIETRMECLYHINGLANIALVHRNTEEMVNAIHSGNTSLHCKWTMATLQVPMHESSIFLQQDVIVGHHLSPCNVLWTSVCALYNINNALVNNIYAAGSVDAESIEIAVRSQTSIHHTDNKTNLKRIHELMEEVEIYSYAAQSQKGGCICINDESKYLAQTLTLMGKGGSSNDFTYRLWDILKDCATAEELVTLMLHALKTISSGKLKPFITPSNNTYFAKIVMKLARGHSQAGKVLKNLRNNVTQSLSLIGQVGFEKTVWEYTNILTIVDNSFGINNVLSVESRALDTTEDINQTIHNMTMGDTTMNPFENKTLSETSVRLDCESLFGDDSNELTVDNFASLKTLDIPAAGDKNVATEVPLIVDEIDISGWKILLMRFAQLHVCLEQLNRSQQCLRLDFESLKSIATRLLEHYACDKSNVKTVGQMINEPVQSFSMPIQHNLVQDHIKNKLASWYKITLCKQNSTVDNSAAKTALSTHIYSQHPVVPPSIWNNNEDDEGVTTEGIKYHYTTYMYLTNEVSRLFSI